MLKPLPLLKGLDGLSHDIVKESAGRPMALVFIAHDCPICNSYAPEFARMASKYGKRVFIGFVYSEPGLSLSEAKRHSTVYGLGGAHLYLDPAGKAATACGATITPEAAVFDAQGQRAYLGRIDNLYYDFGKQRPAATRHDLREALEATIARLPAQSASGPPFGCVIETSIKP